MTRLRLPILQDPPEDDPLELLRGGRFARWFMASLAVLGLAWIVTARVEARTADLVLVHTALATPPPPPVEDITPQRAPPPPPVEDITEDRFGRDRNNVGALVLSEEEGEVRPPRACPTNNSAKLNPAASSTRTPSTTSRPSRGRPTST